VQEIRIDLRREALKEEAAAILKAHKDKRIYQPVVYENGDTKKQLLARSHYLLFKSSSNWTESQKQRADVLFKYFPQLHHAYNLSMMFRSWYETNRNKQDAKENLQKWYEKVEQENIEPFIVAAQSILAYEDTITLSLTTLTTAAPTPPPNPLTPSSRALEAWSEGSGILNSFCFG